MKPVIGDLPQGDNWAHELKWDGMRLCVTVTAGTLRLHSGSGRDVTGSFPELEAFAAHVGADAVFDAEAVVFEGDQPSFTRLQSRIHVATPSQELVNSHPVVLVVFDLLELGDNNLTGLDYLKRRELLHNLLRDGPGWRVPPHVQGHGEALLELTLERGLEGVVSKRVDSLYRPGTRSRSWVKVKVTHSQEFVVGGWVHGGGKLTGQIGSVLVGVYAERNNPDAPLLFAGRCGSGLTDTYRTQLATDFINRDDSPFLELPRQDKVVQFVEPITVVEVGFGQWELGRQLRPPNLPRRPNRPRTARRRR